MVGGQAPGPPAFSLRPPRAEEYEQLYALHRAAMGDYIVRTWGPWDDAQQRGYLDDRYAKGNMLVVEVEGEIAGIFEHEKRGHALFLANIEFLPAYQGRGIGTVLVRGLIADAVTRGLSVELTVLRVNPARRLYERLGFIEYDLTETHHYMRWSQPGAGK